MHCILLHKCLNFFKALHVALVFYQVCQYFCSISEPELPDNHWRSLQVKTSLQTFTLRNDNDQPVCHLVFLCLFSTLKWCSCLNTSTVRSLCNDKKVHFHPILFIPLIVRTWWWQLWPVEKQGYYLLVKWYAIVNHEYTVPFIYISFSLVQMQYFSQIQGRKISWIPLFLSSYFWHTAYLLCTWVVLYSGLRQHGC